MVAPRAASSSEQPEIPELPTLRAQFPVLAEHAYLNAGTDGPLPAAAVRRRARGAAARARGGRTHAHFERRARARGLRCGTRTPRCSAVRARSWRSPRARARASRSSSPALGSARGDEILTSDEEHPGLLGALQAAQRAPRRERARGAAAGDSPRRSGRARAWSPARTSSWVERAARAGRARAASTCRSLLDGAQGVGRDPGRRARARRATRMPAPGRSGCAVPTASGMLYVSPALQERLQVSRRGYGTWRTRAGLDGAPARGRAAL